MIQNKKITIHQPGIAVAMQPAGSEPKTGQQWIVAGTTPTPAHPLC